MANTIKAEYKKFLKTDKIKAIITDLDNTLWSGILAEKQKLILNKKYYNFLQSLYARGIQIIVVSKNDQPAVLNAFKKLHINRKIFTIIISNWDPKYLNIEKIISQANFRPETVIFIDDNPLERTEVQAKIRRINVLDVVDWPSLEYHPYIKNKKTQSVQEIEYRVNRYRTAFRIKELKIQTKDSAEFLNKLNREISIGEIGADNLDRFTRLLVETHRINFNPEKFANYDKTLDYLHQRLNAGDKLFAISTREGGYSLGLTGCLVINVKGKIARITDGTFSCGIIGRGFEQKSLLVIIEKFQKKGIKTIAALVTLNSTNQRVRECLEELGFIEKFRRKNKVTYTLNLDRYVPVKIYRWIKLLATPPELDYTGHPAVISFFEKYVKPLIANNWSVINIGSSHGEVLGFLQKNVRKNFYDFLKQKHIVYKKIDQEYYPDEQNIVANAENLKKIIKNESQNLVIAVELLEHTEHFWRIINEMIRICKVGSYIFITVPSYNYPKHEYPVDLWRIGPKTLSKFFPKSYFKIIKIEKEGNKITPRRTLILVRKQKSYSPDYHLPTGGKTNWKTGLTIFI